MVSKYHAKIYEAPEGSEIIGALIFPYFNNLASNEIDPILEKHNLTKESIIADGWYPMQLVYDISKEVSPRTEKIRRRKRKEQCSDVTRRWRRAWSL
jgi:hypothetical protein